MTKNTPSHVRPRFLFLFVLLVAACQGGGDKKGADSAVAAAPGDARMQEGLDLLYKRGDPVAAEQAFRDVLKENPNHYGAHFQLATALDREGKPTEARPMWEQVLHSAEAIKDTATASMARTRLAAPDTVGAEAMMAVGLNLLNTQNNPSAAAEQFRKVLERNPTHYGATYQLATALDKSGKQAEAHPLWVKVLAMATTYKDEKTAEAARTRLKQNP
ncbi:MAG: tetratricopeptide repeat protein [Gemmatimonadaceae bacterium]